MAKHYEKLDARLASIDGSLAAVAKVFVLLVETGLIEKLSAVLPDAVKPAESQRTDVGSVADIFCVTESEIQAGLWMSRKEAWMYLCTVKSTLEGMIRAGELKKFHRVGDRAKRLPRVWLRRADVEKHYGDYTLFKGKDRN